MFFKSHVKWERLFHHHYFSKLEEFKITPYSVNDCEYYLVKVNNELKVFEKFCPHQKANLIDGECKKDGSIICPWHKYAFDLNSGRNLSTSGNTLKTFPTKLEDDMWYVGITIKLPFWMDP